MWSRRLFSSTQAVAARAAPCVALVVVAGTPSRPSQGALLADEGLRREERRRVKVVLCSNAFKECISAQEACNAMRRGVEAAAPDSECVVVPMADGGDSTLEVIVEGCGGVYVAGVEVKDPLGRPVKATYGMVDDGKTAVIEMAKCSGLALLLPHEKDALKTSTFGTGQLIAHALNMGATKILLCIGGSATNDGGTGAAHALGYRFLDSAGLEIEPCGGNLLDIKRIDSSNVHPRLREAHVTVACDVTNPLCGPSGATAVYGPQKGAVSKEAQAQLDSGLDHLSKLWASQLSGTPQDLALLPGAGAAGGLGGGAVAFFGATFQPGFGLVAEQMRLEQALAGAQLAITGEGMIDEQTGSGKVPYGVAVLADKLGVPLAGIFGGIKEPAKIRRIPIFEKAPIFSLCGAKGPMTLEQAMDPDTAKSLIELQAFNITLLYLSRDSDGRGHSSLGNSSPVPE